jgi:imidazolonepropionase-like amidohydrolase
LKGNDLDRLIVTADSYFDGHVYQDDGPYMLLIENGYLSTVEPITREPLDLESTSAEMGNHTSCYRTSFLMPGLVDAHCHLFLDGGVLDFKKRSEYLKASTDEMMNVARKNVRESLARGITLIRDAGDKYNINHSIKEEISRTPGCQPVIRSPGLGLRRPKRYGSFFASEVHTNKDIVRYIKALSDKSDDLKIILTGIINFEAGGVNGGPQFDLESLRLIVKTALDCKLPTFAHCSGMAGLELAVEAGVDSIEHGFFIDRTILERMAEKNIAWVPTFSPLQFQWERPDIAGWAENTVENLRKIIESHKDSIVLADEVGVSIVAGSDAGSQGVRHGDALINELFFLLESGLPLETVLRSATSTPRKLWGETSADLVPGNQANFVALGGDPFQDSNQLWNVQAVYKDQFHLIAITENNNDPTLPHVRRTG